MKTLELKSLRDGVGENGGLDSVKGKMQEGVDKILRARDYVSQQQLALNHFHQHFPYFWAGQDVCTTEDLVVDNQYAYEVKVKINKKHFPDFEFFIIHRSLLNLLRISTRSCFAQSGIHVISNPIHDITDKQIDVLNSGGDIEIRVFVLNSGNAYIHIGKEEGLFRFYGINQIKNVVRGRDLYDLVKSGEFKVEGNYGETWQMMDIEGNLLPESEVSMSERLHLFLTGNKYQPTSEGIVKVNSKRDLPKVLTLSSELPNTGNELFEIGETSYVELGESIVGVIEEGGYDNGSIHISSPLIDPGFKGPIRTEIYGCRDNRNEFIEMMVLRK
ncbi:MAG: hypothetical protein PHH06_05415 [Candidatus Gracilibacteria bacterium]|nr:hypothetical protein [Candidatus Gracilibacteria bacterium]